MEDDGGPLARLRDNATEVVSLVVTATWLGALFTNQEWWLAALLVGYVLVVPLTEILAGAADEEEDGDEQGATEDEADAEDPLDTLRRRYAEGELTEAEFERKVERLLATEDEADAETLLERERAEASRERERNTDR